MKNVDISKNIKLESSNIIYATSDKDTFYEASIEHMKLFKNNIGKYGGLYSTHVILVLAPVLRVRVKHFRGMHNLISMGG